MIAGHEQRGRIESAIVRVLPYGASAVAGLLFVLLPAIGRAVWGDGHTSGAALGLLLAIAFSVILGVSGVASAVQQVRKKRSGLLIAAGIVDAALAAGPVSYWLAF